MSDLRDEPQPSLEDSPKSSFVDVENRLQAVAQLRRQLDELEKQNHSAADDDGSEGDESNDDEFGYRPWTSPKNMSASANSSQQPQIRQQQTQKPLLLLPDLNAEPYLAHGKIGPLTVYNSTQTPTRMASAGAAGKSDSMSSPSSVSSPSAAQAAAEKEATDAALQRFDKKLNAYYANSNITEKLIQEALEEAQAEVQSKFLELGAESLGLAEDAAQDSAESEDGLQSVDNDDISSVTSFEVEDEVDIAGRSVAFISSKNEVLKARLAKVQTRVEQLQHQELICTLAIPRATVEHVLNNQECETEKRLAARIEAVLRKVDAQIQRQEEQLHAEVQSKDTSKIMLEIMELGQQFDGCFAQLKEALREREEARNTLHSRRLAAVQHTELEKQRLILEKKNVGSIQLMQKRAAKRHEDLRQASNALQLLKHKLLHRLHIVSREQSQLHTALRRVVNMLKGKEELPSGEFINVKQAIGLYADLREAVQKGTFNKTMFRRFIARNPLFGIELEDYEEAVSDVDMTALVPQKLESLIASSSASQARISAARAQRSTMENNDAAISAATATNKSPKTVRFEPETQSKPRQIDMSAFLGTSAANMYRQDEDDTESVLRQIQYDRLKAELSQLEELEQIAARTEEQLIREEYLRSRRAANGGGTRREVEARSLLLSSGDEIDDSESDLSDIT